MRFYSQLIDERKSMPVSDHSSEGYGCEVGEEAEAAFVGRKLSVTFKSAGCF